MNESSLILNRDQFTMMQEWERNELDCDETVRLFQALINSGMAYKLADSYRKTADALIDAGYCNPRHWE